MNITKLTGLVLAAIITAVAAIQWELAPAIIFLGWCILLCGYMSGGENK